MGHCDSSEKQRGAGGVCGADGGFGAVDEERVSAVMNTSDGNEAKEIDRLRSVPPPALTNASDEEGAASPISTATGKHSVGVKAALAALRIYKVYLSVLFAGSCRFEPTCSRYAYEAIERFGVMRGSWMGLKRLLRCHPLSRRFGYDPVPEKIEAVALQAGGVRQNTGQSGVTSREAHS
jgi:putative membrane protein insertion efficiency factor